MTPAQMLILRLRHRAAQAGESPPYLGKVAMAELESELKRFEWTHQRSPMRKSEVVPVHVDLGALHRAADLALEQAKEPKDE